MRFEIQFNAERKGYESENIDIKLKVETKY